MIHNTLTYTLQKRWDEWMSLSALENILYKRSKNIQLVTSRFVQFTFENAQCSAREHAV